MKRSMCHWPTLLSQYPPSAIHFSHPRSEPATVRSAAFRLCTTLGACSAVTIDRALRRERLDSPGTGCNVQGRFIYNSLYMRVS